MIPRKIIGTTGIMQMPQCVAYHKEYVTLIWLHFNSNCPHTLVTGGVYCVVKVLTCHIIAYFLIYINIMRWCNYIPWPLFPQKQNGPFNFLWAISSIARMGITGVQSWTILLDCSRMKFSISASVAFSTTFGTCCKDFSLLLFMKAAPIRPSVVNSIKFIHLCTPLFVSPGTERFILLEIWLKLPTWLIIWLSKNVVA